jgi:hypothetical protein
VVLVSLLPPGGLVWISESVAKGKCGMETIYVVNNIFFFTSCFKLNQRI